MKLLLPLAAAASVSTTVQACLHFWGYIVHDIITGDAMDSGSKLIDNGIVICDNDWSLRLEGGRFIYGCLDGFSLSVSKNGGDARYRVNGQDFHFRTGAKTDKYCCHWACDDIRGVKISCTEYYWDHWEYC